MVQDGDELHQRANCRVDRQFRLTTPNDPLQQKSMKIINTMRRREVQLEIVNPSPMSTHSTRESEWVKAKTVLHAAMTLQFHYGGCFVSDHSLRYSNGITSVEKINIDVDELHIMLFHKIALELSVENVETFGCKVNKKRTFYMLNTDSDVLNYINSLKGVDFIDVYVVHPISIPLVVEKILVLPSINADVSSSSQQDNVDVSSSPHKNKVDLSSSPQIDRADVSSSQPFDENKNRDLNQNQSPLVEEQSPFVEEKSPAPRVEEHSDSDSLYDVDENIDNLSDLDEELLQAGQSNIQEQVKEKTDRVNLDEILSGPIGIDASFKDIYKEMRGRFEDNLDGDDPYFDSLDPDSDISEGEGDPIENDEVVDPTPRKESTKIYFDPIAKKILFQLYMIFLNHIKFREALQTYSIQKGVNIKLKPNEKERIMAKCNKKDNCEVKFNGDLGFEIHDLLYKHVLDLNMKETYNRFIQPMTNMKMWPKSDRPAIEPLEITAMPGRPGKNRRKDSNEPVKKKFGKATRNGRRMKCFVCNTFEHNKKRCPTLVSCALMSLC
ncbi:hypothetical protein H5410_016477 [Solanum commersonii]|uniref:PB1-like domain-containing protein n=1 Tax=Solanum commersonii TaxID=4109 RepID=A0A9J5ZWC4_SOLCO|nr:hypothetical protein H5410_016477 [Solanum commersonii]